MTVKWRRNRGMEVLENQIAKANPGCVIGCIGDARHASENPSSDHNPKRLNGANVVNAIDPMVGKDLTKAEIDAIVNAIVASRDPRIKYIIWQRRIISGNGGTQPWVWRKYTGTSDPHTGHAHISVRDSADTNTAAWAIVPKAKPTAAKPAAKPAVKPAAKPAATLQQGSHGAAVKAVQKKLGLTADGLYGPLTAAAVARWQRKHNLTADGIAGPKTRAAMGV